MSNQVEKRLFHRINFDIAASLNIGDTECRCQLLDLSLKGALIELIGNGTPDQGALGQLLLNLGADDEQIIMDVQVIRVSGKAIGISCINIDIDSISHLRRLIELNTGDSNLLDRELQTLFQVSTRQLSTN